MTAEPTLWSFIANASWVVKIVMLILLSASIASWTIIFQRISLLSKFRRKAFEFEQRFWSGIDLNQLFSHFSDPEQSQTGLSSVFVAGFKEFKRLYKKPHVNAHSIVENTERAMRITGTREIEMLEQPISFLATVGSTSPYVGLFGTVWGIMTSFQGLALGHAQATLAMVAPGISEALIATAIGLFAAIPAVVGYNRLNHKIDQIANQYEAFQEEFIGVLVHQMETTPREASS
jgi:biopolymer transport protein TolQ